MIRRGRIAIALAPLLAASCATSPEQGTLASLRTVEADVAEVEVADTLELAMQSYRRYLEETPTSAMTLHSPASTRRSRA